MKVQGISALVQAFWALASVSKSNVKARKDAASSILMTAKKHQQADREQQKLYTQFPAFCDQLIKLCHFMPSDKVRCAPWSPAFSTFDNHFPMQPQSCLEKPMPVQ